MSRHKLVKTMNLEDELDDFDGVDNYGYDGEAGFEERTALLEIGHKCNEAKSRQNLAMTTNVIYIPFGRKHREVMLMIYCRTAAGRYCTSAKCSWF